MKTILKYAFFLVLIAGTMTGCDNNDTYPTPENILVTYDMTPTITVAEVKDAASGTATEYTEDDIIEGYVTSNDLEGNFYNSISLQTIPTDGSEPIGFSVTANFKAASQGFIPGRKAYIKLKGLYTAIVDGSLKIGALYQGEIGRISENDWQEHLFPSATLLDENTFVTTVTLAEAADNDMLNRLVELDNVEFTDSSINRTYFDVDSGGGATNHDIISVSGGTTRYFRVSSFAPFSKKQVAQGSGKIRGVMTKYGSDYQFLVRNESDIKLTNPRAVIHSPKGGTDIQFNGTLTEPFNYALTPSDIFPKYVNDQTVGNRYWQMKQFPAVTGNKYIEMTSFGGGGVTAKTYFFVPVDFAAANNFTFKKEIRYNAGEVLKVYYVKSSDYTAGGPFYLNTFSDITSAFTITYPAIGSSDNTFTTAGTYNIPASLTGTGFFVFEYSGTPTVTTTIQLDDITIN